LRRVNPRASRALQGAINKGFTRLDQMAAASPSAAFHLAAASRGAGLRAQRVADCAKAPPPTISDSFSSSGGGGRS
jgi:hypothetical protein